MPRTERICTCTRAKIRAPRLALFLAASLGAASAAGAQPARPLGDERLDALAQRYFASDWRLNPIEATQTGVHDEDDELGSFTAEGYGARLELARSTLAELRAIDPGTMGAEAADDARILESRLEAKILDLSVLESWKHRPAGYAQEAAQSVYELIDSDFAPLADRMRSAVAREQQIPAMLEAAASNVTTVDATTVELARADLAGTLDFFSNAAPLAFAPVKDAELAGRFKISNAATVAALRRYAKALETGPFAHPSGSFAIGASAFAEKLRLQELTPISLATYESVGRAALEATRSEFVATAKRIDPSAPPESVAAALGASHPAADALLATAGNDLRLLREFVAAHHLVTLPPDDDVTLAATPEFARQTTFASMDAPGPLETKATRAYYYVTPVEPGWSAERKEQHLSFFNDFYFPIVSAHEVMPGHYLNFALDRHERLSLIRKLLPSDSFAEGWAHYDEQMIVDEGWGDGNPRVRLAQLQGALLRECRLLVGLREHTQNMSVDAATVFFEKNAFLAADPARREALRGTQDPLYGYYTLGKLELLKLREDYRRIAGSHYSLEAFHDSLLAHGDPPIAIAREAVLGADDDGKLL
jgi:uncharacterized protein (DUF885 family)